MEMSALWQGVVSGSATPALPAFFPKSAYLQLKSISGAEYDYTDRLVANFGADVGAAHALLGADASTATLLQVEVPEQYGPGLRRGCVTTVSGTTRWPTPGLSTQRMARLARSGSPR